MRTGNAFVVNTAGDRPVTTVSEATGQPSNTPQPIRLDAGVPYCFTIKSAGGEERRGHFTTLRAQ